jgi:hypothetical protein
MRSLQASALPPEEEDAKLRASVSTTTSPARRCRASARVLRCAGDVGASDEQEDEVGGECERECGVWTVACLLMKGAFNGRGRAMSLQDTHTNNEI